MQEERSEIHATDKQLSAGAQRDGRLAEYKWGKRGAKVPLLPSLSHAAKFSWRPLLECRAVTLPV